VNVTAGVGYQEPTLVREGRNRDQDTLNDVFFVDPRDGVLSRSNFETAKTRYYHLRGWDEQGRPTRRTLARFGLADIADRLYGVNP
jgi:aldehyde:ferredoxin oxidoreductase